MVFSNDHRTIKQIKLIRFRLSPWCHPTQPLMFENLKNSQIPTPKPYIFLYLTIKQIKWNKRWVTWGHSHPLVVWELINSCDPHPYTIYIIIWDNEINQMKYRGTPEGSVTPLLSFWKLVNGWNLHPLNHIYFCMWQLNKSNEIKWVSLWVSPTLSCLRTWKRSRSPPLNHIYFCMCQQNKSNEIKWVSLWVSPTPSCLRTCKRSRSPPLNHIYFCIGNKTNSM